MKGVSSVSLRWRRFSQFGLAAVLGLICVSHPAWARTARHLAHFGACVLPAFESDAAPAATLGRHGVYSVGYLPEGDEEGEFDAFVCDSQNHLLRQLVTSVELDEGGGSPVHTIRFRGNLVVLVLANVAADDEEYYGTQWSIRALNMTTGRHLTAFIGQALDAENEGDGFGESYTFRNVVVGPSGAIAWLAAQSFYSLSSPVSGTTWAVTVLDNRGVRRVATVNAASTSSALPLSDLTIGPHSVSLVDQGKLTTSSVGGF